MKNVSGKILALLAIVGAITSFNLVAAEGRSDGDGFCKSTRQLLDGLQRTVREHPLTVPVRPQIERHFIQPANRMWEKQCEPSRGATPAR